MTEPERKKCIECGKRKATATTGVWSCPDCNAVWWNSYDAPRKGKRGKGYACFQCDNKTLHKVATVGDGGAASVWRCRLCAATIITTVQHDEEAAD